MPSHAIASAQARATLVRVRVGVRVRVRVRIRVEVRVGVRVGVRTGIRVGIGVRVRAGARVSDDLPRAIGPIEEGHRAADLRGVLGLTVGLVTPEVEDRNVPVRG